MSTIRVTDETKKLLDDNKGIIKEQYITNTLFLDSAVKAKLRRLGIKTGKDEIVEHLKRLQRSRQSHLDKLSVKRLIKRHEDRMRKAINILDDLDVD